MSRKDRAESLLVGDFPVYASTYNQVLAHLGTDATNGLTADQVVSQRELCGSNALEQVKPKNPLVMLFFHVFSSVSFILFAVFALTMINKEYIDSAVLLVIIFANALIGWIQELKSEKSLNALQRMSAGTADVIRNGISETIGIDQVVVGDIITLKQGSQVPADARLIKAINLEVDEALLTGESMPVNKHTAALEMPKKIDGLDIRVALGDRTNMVFRQTNISVGTAVAVVTAAGYDTKVGQLSKALEGGGDELTPMQKNMNLFLYTIFGLAIVIAFVIFAITKFSFDKDTTIYASATGIAILPESLIAVVTVALSLAVTRMANKRAVVRKLASVETLGTITNICSDKTGTLTTGKMTVKRFWPATSKFVYHVTGGALDATAGFGVEFDSKDPSNLSDKDMLRIRAASRAQSTHSHAQAPSFKHDVPQVLQGTSETEFSAVQQAARDLAFVSGMCNNTQLQVDEENDQLIGNGTPTELALSVFSFKVGMSPAYFIDEEGWATCGQWAFDSSVKCMSVGVVRSVEGQRESRILCKGAPEAILPKCVGLDADAVMDKVNHLASQGFRVLACAIGDHLELDDAEGKRLHDYDRPLVEKELRFVGLVMVMDPPREESLRCVQECRQAGVQFHMVTGDHQLTAQNIARRIQILRDHDGVDRVTTGPIFDAMSEETIDAMPELPLVIARCSPDSKVKMVEALHRRGKIVAMTGDGINDAPAIKIADVGAAMGIAGVDVTKNTADIVLTDDNIATLVSAVEEGRHAAASVKKFVVHILTGNFAEVIVLLFGLIFRDDRGDIAFPLSPLEILWINMITSTPPAIGLSLDPMDPGAMKRYPDTGSFFSRYVVMDQAVYGAMAAAMCFIAYVFVLYNGEGSFGYDCNSHDGYDTCELLWRARTTCFVTMNLILLCHGYVCRHTHRSLTEFSLVNNKVLLWSVILGVAILFPIVYIPVICQKLFKHRPISWEWAVAVVCLVVFLLGTETWKYIKRSYGIDMALTNVEDDVDEVMAQPEPVKPHTVISSGLKSPRPAPAKPADDATDKKPASTTKPAVKPASGRSGGAAQRPLSDIAEPSDVELAMLDDEVDGEVDGDELKDSEDERL